MYDWYSNYYRAVASSAAHAQFCERVFGRDLAQHGFSDMAQLDRLLAVARLGGDDHVLDLGCGNGGMAAYVATASGARVTGIDNVAEAIRQAGLRACAGSRLSFTVMDIAALGFAPASFSAVIAIDTLYFTDLSQTIGDLRRILRPAGQVLAYYSYGVDPEHPRATFDRATLPADKTPLACALAQHGFSWTAWDVTAADYAHARLKLQVAEELRAALAAEGNLFLYENRAGEARGVMSAIADGLHARYLYRATLE